MKRKLDNKWKRIRAKSQSRDKFDRVAALATAAASLENALTAHGIERRSDLKFMDRILKSSPEDEPDWPSLSSLESAVKCRNKAVHDIYVPEPDECEKHVYTFYKAWKTLRRKFVTLRSAASFAQEFLESGYFSDIFLFGSLARNEKEPSDIDLLLLDNGEFSFIVSEYSYSTDFTTELLLEVTDNLTEQNRAAVRSGWLDCVVIEGKRFGVDREYTDSISKKQRDPLFFVNIADNLLRFNNKSNSWIDNRPAPFLKLAKVRTDPQYEYLVPRTPEARFLLDHPPTTKTAFLIMQFQNTDVHQRIFRVIKESLNDHGIQALRADEKFYHDELWANITTYMLNCTFSIAVLERLLRDDFNPNVSLEIGYMLALKKPLCLLKDKTIKYLQSDLIGRLYWDFDTQDPENTIPQILNKWLSDEELIG